MSDSPTHSDDSPYDDQDVQHKINLLCNEFESLWQLGNEPSIDDFATRIESENRASLIEALVVLEARMRSESDPDPTLPDLRDRSSSEQLESTIIGSGRTGVGDQESVQPLQKIAHFHLLRVVGEGAFGTVWHAEDLKLHRDVALKVPKHGILDPNETQRFLHEARSAAQLDHPNIVRVYEVGDSGPTAYIASALVKGQTLDRRIHESSLSMTMIASICHKLADSLSHAHQQGIIHRDLKPGNIMIDDQDEPYVMDFGLARQTDTDHSQTVRGALLGTPAYMSPEQARGDAYLADARSDLYSLGVVMFQLLTGDRPFRGSLQAMVSQVIYDPPPQPRKLNPEVPQDLETICLKCMEKSPDRRYQTAEELANELERYLDGRPILARKIGSLDRAWRWCRRKPVIASLASSLVVITIAALIAITSLWLKSATNERSARHNARIADVRRIEAERERLAAIETQMTVSQQTSRLLLERGLEYCAIGQTNRGLLSMFESLDVAPDREQDRPWHAIIRRNLAAWLPTTFERWFETDFGVEAMALTFSPDGKYLFVGGMTGIVKKYDVAERCQVGETLQLPIAETGWSAVWDMVYSARHQQLLIAAGAVDLDDPAFVFLVDPDTFELIDEPIDAGFGTVQSLAFLDNERELILAGGSTLQSHTGHLIHLQYPSRDIIQDAYGLPGVVKTIAINERDRLLYAGTTGDGSEGMAIRFELDEFQSLELIEPHDSRIGGLTFDSELETLSIADARRSISLRSVNDGSSMLYQFSHPEVISELSFSADGRYLRVSDESKASILVDRFSYQIVGSRLQNARYVDELAESQMIATLGDQSVGIWISPNDHAQRQQIGNAKQSLDYERLADIVAVSQDGQMILTGSQFGYAFLTDSITGCSLIDPIPHQYEYVRACAFSPNGKLCATACQTFDTIDCIVQIWDTETGGAYGPPFRPRNTVMALTFSHDGSMLAFGDYSNLAYVVDTESFQVDHILQQADIVLSLRFSPDGRELAVAVADDRFHQPSAQRWDLETGLPIGDPLPHSDYVTDVRYSPDQSKMISVSRDATVKIWDLASGTQIGDSLPYAPSYGIARFSPDGRWILTGGDDGAIRLWNVNNATPIDEAIWRGKQSVTALSFDSTSQFFAAAFQDGTCRLFSVNSFFPISRPFAHASVIEELCFDENNDTWTAISIDGSSRTYPIDSPLDGDRESVASRLFTRLPISQIQDRGSILQTIDEELRDQTRVEQLPDAEANASWLAFRAREAEVMKAHTASVYYLTQLVELDPSNAVTWCRLGLAKAYLGKWEEAEQDMVQANQLQTDALRDEQIVSRPSVSSTIRQAAIQAIENGDDQLSQWLTVLETNLMTLQTND